MTWFRGVWTITVRFMRQQVRNKPSVIVSLGVPLLLAGVLGFADQRANSALPVGLVHREAGPFGEQLAEEIRQGQALRAAEKVD